MEIEQQTTSANPTVVVKKKRFLSWAKEIFLLAWYLIRDLFAAFLRFFNIKQIYYLDAHQAYRKILSEYAVIHSVILAKEKISAEEHDTIQEIDLIIAEANRINHYEELWPFIHLIELQILRLYDLKALLSHLIIIRNNLYVLDEEDRKRWEPVLTKFDVADNAQPLDENYFRNVIYSVTAEIQEARRLNFMTTDLKHALMKRFFWITLGVGILAWGFAFAIIRDPLVHYAVIFGLLGGFFSRVLALKSLEFKPAAFSLLALYTYIQPLLGGVGALILYLILISPLGPQVISGDTFYLSDTETHNYIVAKISDSTTVMSWKVPALIRDTSLISTSKVISQYPKPGMFLLLAFLAGFSERWLLGTLETIVGKKLQKDGDGKSTPEVKPAPVTTTPEVKP
ncbi:MAG: hypothetical protein WCS69_04335 [Ignavibacteriaceae bacterium]|jgi:hypothetical protein